MYINAHVTYTVDDSILYGGQWIHACNHTVWHKINKTLRFASKSFK